MKCDMVQHHIRIVGLNGPHFPRSPSLFLAGRKRNQCLGKLVLSVSLDCVFSFLMEEKSGNCGKSWKLWENHGNSGKISEIVGKTMGNWGKTLGKSMANIMEHDNEIVVG